MLPFALDPGEWLEPEPRPVFDEGAVFGAAAPVLLTVAWLDEPEGVTLEAVVEQDVARFLSGPGVLLADREKCASGSWTPFGPSRYRIWTEGEIARAEVLGGDPCPLVTDRPSDERALLEIAAEQVPMALVVWLRLRPRPVPRASSSSWHRPPPPSWSASWWR